MPGAHGLIIALVRVFCNLTTRETCVIACIHRLLIHACLCVGVGFVDIYASHEIQMSLGTRI